MTKVLAAILIFVFLSDSPRTYTCGLARGCLLVNRVGNTLKFLADALSKLLVFVTLAATQASENQSRLFKKDTCYIRMITQAADVRAGQQGLGSAVDIDPGAQINNLQLAENEKWRAYYERAGYPLRLQIGFDLTLIPHSATPADSVPPENVPPDGNRFHYTYIDARLLPMKDFESLNRSLGSAGLWFIFRSYSWRHLGFEGAGPHMSVVIGERVFEIGRIPERKTAGPIATDLPVFLEKVRAEGAALRASPGVFLAQRFPADEEAMKTLADDYQSEADAFRQGAHFRYVMDPSQRCASGDNCVTYPLKVIQRHSGLQRALGIPKFGITPQGQLREGSSGDRTVLFADSALWTGWRPVYRSPVYEHPTLLNGGRQHPQLAPFFFTGIFLTDPRVPFGVYGFYGW